MFINLEFDAAAMAAPASFRAAIQQAASMLDSAISNAITVNIDIEYGEQNIPTTSAEAGPNDGVFVSYSTVRADLMANDPGDPNLASLPTGTTIGGQTQVAVWDAQEKLFGILPANGTEVDGTANFGTAIASNLLVGVALHELTHALGRVPYGPEPDIFDFYRYTSSGTRLFAAGNTAPAAYFSLDGGKTVLADYGQTSDPSDFLNNSLTPEDAFNEFYDSHTIQNLTSLDLTQLDALGFSTSAGTSTLNWSVVATGDFNHDLTDDVMWRNGNTGVTETWLMSGGGLGTVHDYGATLGWTAVAVGDFNHDGTTDVMWRNDTSGVTDTWTMSNGSVKGATDYGKTVGWSLVAVGDFNDDGTTDVMWRNNTSGVTEIWTMSNGSVKGASDYGMTLGWSVVAVGDFNHDGTTDVMWRNDTSGVTETWTMSNGAVKGASDYGATQAWTEVATGDFNGDGTTDVMWKNNTSGVTETWTMSNGAVKGATDYGATNGWSVAATGHFFGNADTDVLWMNDTSGATELWNMSNGTVASATETTNMLGWQAVAVGDMTDSGTDDIMWQNASSGQTLMWLMNQGNATLKGLASPAGAATSALTQDIASLPGDGSSAPPPGGFLPVPLDPLS